jgi:aldose 1-epimerase
MLEISFKAQKLSINTRGGGIAEYFYYRKIGKIKKRVDIVYGYGSKRGCDGGMGDILSPFPGRVKDGRYCFEGNYYNLSGFQENNGYPLHAFVRELNWYVKKTAENSITSTLDVKSGDFKKNGYPFSLKYKIIYTLGENSLDVETEVKNIGDKTAPFGIGFHPYFCVEDKVDDMIWQVPAKSLVEFDEELKPTGRLIPTAKSDLNFLKQTKIGSKIIDNCFTNLVRDSEGVFTSRLASKDGSKVIEIWQDESYPYFQTYSADTIDPKNFRKAIALEPQSCCGYAVNYENMGLIKLLPEQSFLGRWGTKFFIS